jgi:autophagy-related protein 9
MAQQTQEETTRFSRILYEAAADAWREHEERRQRERFLQHNHRSSSDPHNTYLQDFGIATGDDDHTSTPTSHEHGENDFIFLPQISNSQHYGAAANLDVFFASLYSYFYHRGLVPIVGKGVVQLVSLLFTLFLSIFLFVYMDWKALATCMDETTCRSTLADYIHQRPFSHGSVWTLLVACYVLIFLVYAAFATWSCLHTIREAIQAKYVFEERLGISARKLEGGAVDWDRDVVDKILELQQSGEYRVAIHGQDLDALIIANRILRKENFMVALFNRDLLDLNVPWLGKHVFFCSSLEVSCKMRYWLYNSL